MDWIRRGSERLTASTLPWPGPGLPSHFCDLLGSAMAGSRLGPEDVLGILGRDALEVALLSCHWVLGSERGEAGGARCLNWAG